MNSKYNQNYLTNYQSQFNNSCENNADIYENQKFPNSKHYFRIKKIIETSPNTNYNKNRNFKRNKNHKGNSINEKIYSKYSEKLGDYYNKNKEDLLFYGSKKYDLLTVDNLVEEMKQYKNIILNKIKQNPNGFKNRNYGLKSHDDNLILTPLAEKDYSKMGSNEKELFNAAERRGVVMRRIEYTNLLDDKNGKNKSENAKVFLVMKDAI